MPSPSKSCKSLQAFPHKLLPARKTAGRRRAVAKDRAEEAGGAGSGEESKSSGEKLCENYTERDSNPRGLTPTTT